MGHGLLILLDDGGDREAAGLRGRLTFKHSLCALVTNRRAAGEGNQARILTAGRREYWEVGRDRGRRVQLKVANLSTFSRQLGSNKERGTLHFYSKLKVFL